MATAASSAASLVRLLGIIALASCASSSGGSGGTASPAPATGTAAPPNPDPRVGLKPGLWDAGQAAWNLRLVSNTPSPEGFKGVINSDLAFLGKYAIQGNYNGYQVWDISNPSAPSDNPRKKK